MKIDFDSYAGFLANRQNMKATLVAKMFINNVAEANETSFSNDEYAMLAYILTQSFHSLQWEFENEAQLNTAKKLSIKFEGLLATALEKKIDDYEYISSDICFDSIYKTIILAYSSNEYCVF